MKTYIGFDQAILSPGGIVIDLPGQQLVIAPQVAQPGQPDVIAARATSPDGTTVPPATDIVDDNGDVWTLKPDGAVHRGTWQEGNGSGIIIAKSNGQIFVLGHDKNYWFKWMGSGRWVGYGATPPAGITVPGTIKPLPRIDWQEHVNGLHVEVTDQGSGPNLVGARMEWGDGKSDEKSGPIVDTAVIFKHDYSTAGRYAMTYFVTNASGGTNTFLRMVEVGTIAPVPPPPLPVPPIPPPVPVPAPNNPLGHTVRTGVVNI